MSQSDTAVTLTSKQKRLRDRIVLPVLEAIRRDRDNAPDGLKVLFETIAENLFGDLDVNTLVRLAKVQRRKLTLRAFSQLTGRVAYLYIRLHRCAAAALLLEHTSLHTWLVGAGVGYDDGRGDALLRNFREVSGQTPSEYRKNPCRDPFADVFGTASADDEDESAVYHDHATLATAAPGEVPRDPSGAHLDDLGRKVREQAPAFAETVHRRGAALAAVGDADGAYEHLDLARRCDALTGTQSRRGRRRGLLSCDPEPPFLDVLCGNCRLTFTGAVGRDLRVHMRQALALVPRGLEWLDPRHSCDDCYRLVWDAVERARLGLLDDAFQAWWLSETADDSDDALPTRGLFILLLHESEKLAYREPRRRLELCRRAVDVARQLKDAELEIVARTYEGNALRALSQFIEAREVFASVEPGSRLWLRASYLRDRGTLDTDAQELETAVDRLRRAAELFRELDPHVAALVSMKLAEALRWQEDLQGALVTFEGLMPQLDVRRWPDACEFLAVNHALHLIAAGQYDRAEERLSKAPQNSLGAPNLTGAWGELRLAQGEFREACRLLEDAIAGQLKREKFDAAVTVTLCQAEAQARDGAMGPAIETAMTALTYSVSGARAKQTLQSLSQLTGYAGSASDLAQILRKLAWESGGALPPAPPGVLPPGERLSD